MHAQILNRVKDTKYIGVSIRSTSIHLNWNKHINLNQVTGKAMLGFVKRNIKTRSQHLKTKAYKGLIRPRLEYCASLWDPHRAYSSRSRPTEVGEGAEESGQICHETLSQHQ